VHLLGDSVYGTIAKNVRFLSIFLVGALYYLHREKVHFTNRGAAVAVGVLVPLMFFRLTAEASFAALGGYLIFWFGFRVPAVSSIGRNTDISYGVYLYAWPLQNSIIWLHPEIDPWVLCFFSTVGAVILGFLSWVLVEKPAMNILRARRKRSA
jgi:peptidoglycan/LPS O-acetylase OafA/YrhL